MVVLRRGCISLTRGAGGAVLTHQSLETHHQPVPSSQLSSPSISLCSSQQLPEAPSQLESRSTPGSERADPPRTHPSFMGCNPRPEWVTGGKMGSQGGRTMGLDVCIHVCFPFPLECTGVKLSASLCQTLKSIQCHYERLEGSVRSGRLIAFVCWLNLSRTCCIQNTTYDYAHHARNTSQALHP